MRRPLARLTALAAGVAALAVLAGCSPLGTVTVNGGAGGGSGGATTGPASLEPMTPPPHTDPADRERPLVAFYGDSYTLGTGSTGADKRWSTIIAGQRGWDEFNPSVNGLGFVNNRGDRDLPAEIISVEPDIVFVTMGLNDNFSYDFAASEIHDAIDRDLARLKKALPEARFVVVEPFWYTDSRPDSVATIIGWVHDAADEIGADWIPDASHWIEGHPEWMAADGLHPNDDGYAHMAVEMDAALKKLDL